MSYKKIREPRKNLGLPTGSLSLRIPTEEEVGRNTRIFQERLAKMIRDADIAVDERDRLRKDEETFIKNYEYLFGATDPEVIAREKTDPSEKYRFYTSPESTDIRKYFDSFRTQKMLQAAYNDPNKLPLEQLTIEGDAFKAYYAEALRREERARQDKLEREQLEREQRQLEQQRRQLEQRQQPQANRTWFGYLLGYPKNNPSGGRKTPRKRKLASPRKSKKRKHIKKKEKNL